VNNMKNLFKILVIFVLLFAIFFVIVFLSLNPQASVFLNNTFVPSEKGIEQISKNNISLPTLPQTGKSFLDFSESTINKDGFYLRIDKIGLFKAIVTDVDPRNVEEYKNSWNFGISHGKFTSKPDQIGLTYLFAHAISNKTEAESKNAWFSNLDQLNLNDSVIIYYKGTKYSYEISNIMAVSPTATAFYTGASPVPMIRMQYCGPPTGSLESRTLVDALLINKEII